MLSVLKKNMGLHALICLKHDKAIEIKAVHGDESQMINISDLVAIIQPRSQELLTLVHEEIIKHKFAINDAIRIGINRRWRLLPGMKELAQEIFRMPVRIGMVRMPHDLPESLESPIYATGYGLLKQVVEQQDNALETIGGPGLNTNFYAHEIMGYRFLLIKT